MPLNLETSETQSAKWLTRQVESFPVVAWKQFRVPGLHHFSLCLQIIRDSLSDSPSQCQSLREI